MKNTKYYSKKIGNISKGCSMCVKGEKLVLFVTGLCSKKCFYCPIAETKKDIDIMFANEWKMSKSSDLINEAKLCDAKGAGITGGDPLVKIDRTIKLIKLLKKTFGKKFHIHLYTPMILVTYKNMKKLFDSGLDEIRFHPDNDYKFWKNIDNATLFKWDIGVEIPVIPNEYEKTIKLIDYFAPKIKFLNLNELEISDTNAQNMPSFKPKNEISYGVAGSENIAIKILKYCEKKYKKLNVHYCTTTLKDKVQMGNRIIKRAKNVSEKFDIVSDIGTLIRGCIYIKETEPQLGYRNKIEKIDKVKRKNILVKLNKIKNSLIKKYEIPNELIKVDNKKLRIITRIDVVEELSELLKKESLIPAIVEEYPTWDAIEIDVRML